MSKMIERVAMAIANADDGTMVDAKIGWDGCGASMKEDYRAEARAAIAAMKNLPDYLYEAYTRAADPTDGPAACHLQTDAYHSMIDAILAD